LALALAQVEQVLAGRLANLNALLGGNG